ncbi:MAG: sugar phosphate isomerase/epimerase [Planctomycetaceae bacterium]|nr:sugar phosphate isomerase/epimerase [Planctomycetaceae bacterium]
MKFALCHELYESIPWPEQCRLMAEAGYTGIEVAPFTISDDLATVPDAVFEDMKSVAQSHGLEIIGLHWLLARTSGFYLTSPDASVRAATADYLKLLARICAGLGGKVLVFGSPQQRSLLPGVTTEQAMQFAAEVFKMAMPEFEKHQVQLCMEPLTPKETDFINTCAQAVELMNMVGSPAMRLHQDVKAMLGGETDSIPHLIAQFKDVTAHFHVNDSNLLGPGMGDTDYRPIIRALLDSGYSGWVSVEVFDYKPGAQNIALQSIEYLKRIMEEVQRADG